MFPPSISKVPLLLDVSYDVVTVIVTFCGGRPVASSEKPCQESTVLFSFIHAMTDNDKKKIHTIKF